MKQLKNDPVYEKIMQTKDTFLNGDNFDPEEAIQTAFHNRKFLIKKLLNDYTFTGDSEDEDH